MVMLTANLKRFSSARLLNIFIHRTQLDPIYADFESVFFSLIWPLCLLLNAFFDLLKVNFLRGEFGVKFQI